MADSNITKRALAAALKELMNEEPFSKISVGDICGKCNMNRKSFYYHFKDKYDLLNWTFDVEFIGVANGRSYKTISEGVEPLIRFFYENRAFYKKALEIEGQNSFTDHFREICCPALTAQLHSIMAPYEVTEFQVNFFVDGIICAIKRWITDVNCISPEAFMAQIKSCVRMTAIHVCTLMDEENHQ